jgi:hypothetical protein
VFSLLAQLEMDLVEIEASADPGLAPVGLPPDVLRVPDRARTLPAAELRFLLARALVLLRDGVGLFGEHTGAACAPLLTSALRVLETHAKAPSAALERLRAAAADPKGLAAWLEAIRLRANRIALMASGDLGAALSALYRLESDRPGAPASPEAALALPVFVDLVRFVLRADVFTQVLGRG